MAFFVKNIWKICCWISCFCISNIAIAQDTVSTLQNNISATNRDDTNQLKTVDSATIKKGFTVIPKKAALYSSIVPGLGQLYNKQYWKIGVVYALLGTGTGFIIYNNREYNYWRKIYAGRLGHDVEYINKEKYLSDNQIKLQQDYHKKNLDLCVLLTGIGYALQVMDAIVFAHLKDFDISPDIGMRIQPVAMPNNGLGIGLVMNLK